MLAILSVRDEREVYREADRRSKAAGEIVDVTEDVTLHIRRDDKSPLILQSIGSAQLHTLGQIKTEVEEPWLIYNCSANSYTS